MAGRRTLVLLDNAHTVEQVRDLLPGTASCFVLVTGRDTMPALVARHGAVRLDLDLLSIGEALDLLRRLIGARVDAEPDHAEDLVRRCAGLPLALRLAAELALSRPGGNLAGLARELGKESRRLDVLAAGGDPTTAVRAVFSWSLRHLSSEAANAFRLLGLHPSADMNRDAAATLIGGDPVDAGLLLDALARAHLLSYMGTGRAAMHDLLHAFAAEQSHELAEEERWAALGRLLEYYRAAAVEAIRRAFPAGDPQALSWLDGERSNLVAVARLAAAGAADSPHSRVAQHTIALSAALAPYLDAHGHYHDALALHGLARDAARAADDRAAEGRAHSLTGTVQRRLGEYRAAVDDYTRALEIHRGTGDRPAEAEALHGLGLCHWRLGQYDDALALFTEALAIYREHGDRANEGRALHGLALVFLPLGRYDDAREHNERAIAVYREVGDRTSEGRSLNNLGIIYHRQARHERAQEHYEAALRIAREVGNRTGEAVALANLGDLAERLGRYGESYAQCERSLVLCRRIGYRVGQAEALRCMGLALHRLGRTDEALEHLRNATALCRELGETDTKIHAMLDLGEVLHAMSRSDEARGACEAALELAESTGDRYALSRARAALEALPRPAS
jgi:tetratricopeptide (TPR) repeat protein